MLTIDVAGTIGTLQIEATIEAGQGVTALVGPSGAGKTTLLRGVAGLWQPVEGRIECNGRVLFDSNHGIDVPTRKRRLGIVFQEPLLFPHLTVAGNLAFGSTRSNAAFEPIVRLLDLEALLSRMPRHLSGGEAQRVALGRALLSDPETLLLDEPLTGLDDARRMQVIPFLQRLRDETALPILYVSHHRDEVARLADLVFTVEQGKVVSEMTPTEYARARDRFEHAVLEKAAKGDDG